MTKYSVLPWDRGGSNRIRVETSGSSETLTKKVATPEPFTAYAEGLHVGRPNIGDLESFFEMAHGIFQRRWFTNSGPLVNEFEEALCQYLGVKHCIPVCNATVGLSILAHELTSSACKERTEVIVPSFTFVATPHSLLWKNITPVFCDIDPQTHNLDPEQVVSLIGPQTKAILGVHCWGRPCCIDELQSIAEHHGIPLYFDSAHAFGCSHQNRMLGNFGRAEVFSFHATKFFNTFEGGAIATNDDQLARRLRLTINFGFSGVDSVETLGINAKMNEISSAMGLSSLPSVSQFIQQNYENYLTYRETFQLIPGLTVEEYPESESMNYQYIVVQVFEEESGFSRDELYEFLKSKNVFARRYFYPPCHKMEPYRSQRKEHGRLPHTESLSERILCFPNGTSVDPFAIRAVASMIEDFRHSRGVR